MFNCVAKPVSQLMSFIVILISLGANNALASEEDPWEGFNRKMFVFNDQLDKYILRPTAVAYKKLTPSGVRHSINSGFKNANEPIVIVSDVAQFKFRQAASDTARFLINSTVGFFGLLDVATHIGLPRHNEDLGQTLGYWGVGTGPYIVLPFFGPKTLRSLTGDATEAMMEMGYGRFGDDIGEKAALYGIRIVDIRSELLEAENLMSGDRYIFMRSAYLQRREFLVNDGVVEDQFEDEFDLFEDDDFDSDDSFDDTDF